MSTPSTGQENVSIQSIFVDTFETYVDTIDMSCPYVYIFIFYRHNAILGVRTKCQNHLTDPDVYSTEWSPTKCINLITKGRRAKHQACVEAVPDLLNDFCRK